jgi:hypothetical protein
MPTPWRILTYIPMNDIWETREWPDTRLRVAEAAYGERWMEQWKDGAWVLFEPPDPELELDDVQ